MHLNDKREVLKKLDKLDEHAQEISEELISEHVNEGQLLVEAETIISTGERFLNLITAFTEGTIGRENFIKESEELFEAYGKNQDENKVFSYTGRMIEHLLKFAYCGSLLVIQDNKKKWSSQISNPRRKLIDLLQWNSKRSQTNLVEFGESSMQDAYEWGIHLYEKDSESYIDLVAGIKLIPEVCPWSLRELLEYDIWKLINKLPNIMRKQKNELL